MQRWKRTGTAHERLGPPCYGPPYDFLRPRYDFLARLLCAILTMLQNAHGVPVLAGGVTQVEALPAPCLRRRSWRR